MNYDCYNLTNVPIINKIKMNTPYSNVSIINITYLNVSSTDTISINTRIIIVSTVNDLIFKYSNNFHYIIGNLDNIGKTLNNNIIILNNN